MLSSGDQEVLKQLSARAVLEFEDVKVNYKKYFEKFANEEAKRRKIEAQFKQLKQVSLLAVAEYESLHSQYITENKYRQNLEEKLKKVVEENREIRKHNNIGANTTILPTNDANDGGAVGTKGELEVLRAMKDAVNTELRNTKDELNRTKELLEQEKNAHEMTKKRLNVGMKQINQLNRVSVLAMDEFSVLKRKFEIETTCRRKAEDVASELVVKQELTERKSRIINEDEQSQLQRFMKEIEEINSKAEEEKKKYETKVRELEEKLLDSQNVDDMKVMEEKLSLVMDQLDLSQKQLVEAEERAAKAETDSRNIYSRLALAERELQSGRSTLPPPPPPPPPPPMAAPVIRNFITRIGKRKKPGVKATQEDDQITNAMADMIARIKRGVKLRPVESSQAKQNEQEEANGAMGALAGLLTNLRQNRQESVDVLDETKTAPEFARLKLKKTASTKSSTSSIENGASHELKKKLEKQKSVADGIDEEIEPIETTEKYKNIENEIADQKPEIVDTSTRGAVDDNDSNSENNAVDETKQSQDVENDSSYEVITSDSNALLLKDSPVDTLPDNHDGGASVPDLYEVVSGIPPPSPEKDMNEYLQPSNQSENNYEVVS